ncbi:pentapeptide repeat-containing protein [Lyngbya aestuarii]|uniref:pentapeptide repeat-containing protein n=1 Tax=Lyngbya aestuarii TaxID=118322 RepID=UPI00403DBA40
MSVNETDDLTELRLWLKRLVAGFSAVGLLVVLPFLWWLNVTPIQEQEAILNVKDFFELKHQAINLVTTSIQILATVFGGIAILFNVYYGAKRAKAFEKNAIAATENAIAATKNAEVAEQGQITERFTKAIEQLGSDNISIRLGGIYALESIAEYSQNGEWSEKYYWTVMEVLSAFVRENAPLKDDLEDEGEQQQKKPRTDIQAALTVIGRRDIEKDPENQRLNLNKVDIAGANLREANLQGAIFREANLQGAIFREANLQSVKFDLANLQGANLYQANLQGADLTKAQLQGTDLGNANLKQACIIEADLQGAILTEANLEGAFLNKSNLQQTNLLAANLKGVQLSYADLQKSFLKLAKMQSTRLCKAKLQGADIRQADFLGASLLNANLEGADLTNAKNLNSQEILSAYGDSTTILPDYVERPARWM